MKASPPHSKRRQPIVVFSHLRWEFVTQRPQHLLTRLAKHHDILYIEEPIPFNGFKTSYKTIKVHQGIKVIQIPGNSVDDLQFQHKAVDAVIDENFSKPPIIWLYSAAFFPLTKILPHQILVYDCMDELSAFKGATNQLKKLERKLLSQADLVFTGGHSLYQAKSKYNGSTHCFPSSVDINHFITARDRQLTPPVDIASIPHPIVGFYGVLDERLDLDLIKAAAHLRPDISFVLIGPIVKIDADSLPKAANIFYLGQKDYQDLPVYLQEFDIAYMPFAKNESTRFISPTKTLEFMAALKPIISTPVTDVVKSYKDTVTIIGTPHQLSNAIDHYLNESNLDRRIRQLKQNQTLNQSSWDKTAAGMENLMTRTIARQRLRLLDAGERAGEYV